VTIDGEDDLEGLKVIGALVADVLQAMGRALEPGMTTRELDALGRAMLEREGALSAPESCYGFPGATCISVNEEVAHGIPGDRIIMPGDLVNIDVSAEKNGYFADTGASFAVPPINPRTLRLCQDGRMALAHGIRAVRAGAPLKGIGQNVERFALRRGYTLIRNLASHGVGRSLHEEPKMIPTWHEARDHRKLHEGTVFTIEPFLSTGAEFAQEADDGWTLFTQAGFMTVQYEHTMVATRRGALILTQPNQGESV
jgi:methionyl aminopeptidase